MTRASLSAVFEQEVLGNLRQIAPKIEQKHPQEHHLFCQKIPRYAPLKVEKTKERKRKKQEIQMGTHKNIKPKGGGATGSGGKATPRQMPALSEEGRATKPHKKQHRQPKVARKLF